MTPYLLEVYDSVSGCCTMGIVIWVGGQRYEGDDGTYYLDESTIFDTVGPLATYDIADRFRNSEVSWP
jgi:hypothetical protein